MFRKMPLILMAIILGLCLLDPYLPIAAKSFLYALSLSIKSLILFFLPFIIFGLLFKVAAELTHSATKIILLILMAVCCSNFISTLLSHYVGLWVYHFDLSIMIPRETKELSPLWSFQLPQILANDKAMYSALILGIGFSFIKPRIAHKCAQYLSKGVSVLLRGLTFLIPFFVMGFIVKLNFDGGLKTIIHDYASIFIVILWALFSYIMLLYFLSNNLSISKFFMALRNMTPAAIAGFSTMSSAAAMPLTIIGTERNAQNLVFARSVIPATVNIHLIGDCFAIPILAFAVLKSYGIAEPALMDYLIFAFYFVLAKFSVAAVPGGGILVMLPILERYLGFNAEMMSLITALYILFDPVITCANVLGNGGFAMVMDKVQQRFVKRAFA